jgi:hypothetical protein
MAVSGNRGGEERVEGEAGGEAEARGRRGCQGEPLRGLPRCLGIVWPGVWEWPARPRGRTWSGRGIIHTMSQQSEPGLININSFIIININIINILLIITYYY